MPSGLAAQGCGHLESARRQHAAGLWWLLLMACVNMGHVGGVRPYELTTSRTRQSICFCIPPEWAALYSAKSSEYPLQRAKAKA